VQRRSNRRFDVVSRATVSRPQRNVHIRQLTGDFASANVCVDEERRQMIPTW
jgi:hypothetical protein